MCKEEFPVVLLIALTDISYAGRVIARNEIFSVNAITAASLLYRRKAQYASKVKPKPAPVRRTRKRAVPTPEQPPE